MVDEFEKWILSNSTYLKDKGVSTDFRRRETPSVAATVTLENKSIVADVTVWDIGACDVDMLSYETGEPIFSKRYDFTSFNEIVPALEEVCNKMTANAVGGIASDGK